MIHKRAIIKLCFENWRNIVSYNVDIKQQHRYIESHLPRRCTKRVSPTPESFQVQYLPIKICSFTNLANTLLLLTIYVPLRMSLMLSFLVLLFKENRFETGYFDFSINVVLLCYYEQVIVLNTTIDVFLSKVTTSYPNRSHNREYDVKKYEL